MTTRKLYDHAYAQAEVYTYSDGTIALVSYKTTVAVIEEGSWLAIRGLYSRTTIKHISWFMRELGLTYQLAKQLYEDGYEMNIHTGEMRRL